MDLSADDIACIQADVESVVRSLHSAHLARGEGTLEHFMTFFDEDVFAIGTGQEEIMKRKSGLRTFIEREWQEISHDVHHVIHSVHVQVLSRESAYAHTFMALTMSETGEGEYVEARLSSMLRKQGDDWKVIGWHASTPWDIQPEGVSWPTDELQARAEKLEKEVAARTEELSRANRELEIDAALERIRRVTGEMKDPSDLIDVVKQIRVEVGALFGGAAVEVGLMQEANEEMFKFWSIVDVEDVPEDLALFGLLYPKKPDPPHPMLDRVWGAEGAFSLLFFDLEDMWRIHASLERYSPEEARHLNVLLESGEIEGGWQTVSSIHVGRMYLGWVEEPPEELASVQPRIAALLTEAQQRVEELQTAQNMAREAEINLAVEKVRARASGMQTSGEIVEVADVLREQMIELGLKDVMACTVYTLTPDGNHRVTEMARLEEESSEFSFDWIFDPAELNPDVMVHDFLAAEEATVFYEDAEAMALLMKEALKFDPDYTEDYQQALDESSISEVWVAVCPSESVRLCIDFKTEPPEEILTILPRMTRAFDHAYRRYRDLERAEAQAREAQIEAALERIRGRAMAMKSSDELGEVSILLDKEVRALGPKTWGCAFNIYGEEDSTEWFGSEAGVQNPYKTPRERYFKEFYDRGQAGESFLVKEFPEGQCAEHYDYMKTLPVLGDILREIEAAGHNLPEFQIDHLAYFKYGYLLFITLEPVPEMHHVFQRFAKVFEQSYTRFLDLERAEAQAREAQIEAALERIRGRALAMRSSREMIQVADELRRQMGIIGQEDLEACAIHIYDTEGDDFESWGAIKDPDGDHAISNVIRMFPKKGVGALEEMIRRYESDESDYVIVNEGEWAIQFFDMLKERAPEPHAALMAQMPPGMKPWEMKAFWSVADFDGGSIVIVSYQPADEESRDLLRRAANVFNLAYRRFKDLREAEVAEREAKIEAALERVRSEAMGMTNSDELLSVVATIHRQFSGLGFECGVFWHARYHEDHYEKALTSVDGSKVSTTMILPRDFSAVPELAAWERGTEPFAVFQFNAEQGGQYMEHMITKGHFLEVDPNAVTPDMVREHGGITFVQARTTHGEIGYSLWGEADPEPEAEDVLLRFARVFDLAHRRYEDLREAEMAAREARIEVALERVRSRAMAMHDSVELSETIGVMFEQMRDLGFSPVSTFLTLMDEDLEGMTFRMTGRDGSSTLTDIRWESSSMPQFEGVRDAWKKGDAVLGAHYTGKSLEDFLEILDPINNQLQGSARLQAADFKNGLYSCSGRHAFGTLGILNAEPVPQDQQDLLVRFAKEFELVYRRFLDLEKAEAQARESKIETSLERVRAQAMAMQKPEDISDVSIRMFDELEALGFESLRSGISIAGEGERYLFHAATKDESGKTTLVLGDESVNVHPIIRRAFDGWKAREAHQVTMLEGDDLLEYYHAVFDTMPLPDWKERMQKGSAAQECFATFPFQDGWLYTFTRQRISDDNLILLERFARVFGLAYQRYHDLKKAEAQARESRIDAALERVRARAMAMQKPEDIGEASHQMFEEFKALCPDVIRMGLGIAVDGGVRPWLVGKDNDGSPFIRTGRVIALGEIPEVDQIINAWFKKEHYQFKESKQFLRLATSIYESVGLSDLIGWTAADDLYMSAFSNQTGVLYLIMSKPVDEHTEEGRLAIRFGSVFDLAYQRYNDLQQAEKDYQALLEEKARTEKALSDLQATQKQLVEQEKLASLGSLTAGIAHEIKNPLNFVNNFAEVSTELMEELAEAVAKGDTEEAAMILDDLRDNATQIAKHGKRADSIVRSMMQHARGGASDREVIVVNDFLEEYANLAWHGMRARDHGFSADVERDFDAAAGELTVMPQELGRVVLNLLNNAFDAVKEQDDAVVTVASKRTDNSVIIRVSDNGPGIPEDIRQKIFEPFFTTKATGEGTGLGLSLSYDIVTKGHGGTMTVDESPDGGALFTVSIPGGAA